MSTVDNSIIKYKNWQHFFNKKFSGKVQHAPWYFRQLSRAAANNGCAALLKGEAYVIAFRSLDEWRQIYDIAMPDLVYQLQIKVTHGNLPRQMIQIAMLL